jgi:hypothetical protein
MALSGNGWVRTISSVSHSQYLSDHPTVACPILSNGVIGILPTLASGSDAGLDSGRTTAESTEGSECRTEEAFHFLRLRFGVDDVSEAPNVYSTEEVRFDMQRAVLHATQTVSTASLDGGISVPLCTVSHSVRALRHLPLFALHSVSVTVPIERQGRHMRLEHIIRSPTPRTTSGTMTMSTAFEGSLFQHDDTRSTFVISASHGDSTQHASVYLFDNDQIVSCDGIRDVADATSDVGAVRMHVVSTPAKFTIHILSCIGFFSARENAAREALLGVMARCRMGKDDAGIAGLVSRHEAAWDDIWLSRVDIEPKRGLGDIEQEIFDSELFALRHSMYTLHASNGVVDFSGTASAGASDIHVRPLLTLFRTSLRPPIRNAGLAKRRASQMGLEGAYFGVAWGEISRALTRPGGGYDLTLGGWLKGQQTGVNRGLNLFGSAILAVNLWEYFRITMDRYWLRDEGFPTMSLVADMLCSAAVSYDVGTTYPYHIKYRLPGTTGFDSTRAPATDQILNVASARSALHAAIEASVEIDRYIGIVTDTANVSVKRWIDVLNGLSGPIHVPPEDPTIRVAMQDADVDVPPNNTREIVDLLYPLYTPSLRGFVFETMMTESETDKILANTMNFWQPRLQQDSEELLATLPDHEFRVRKRRRAQNCIAIMHSAARSAQSTEPSAVNIFQDNMRTFLEEFGNVWGAPRLVDTHEALDHSDIDLSAALLLAITQGLVGLSVNVSVADTDLYLSDMDITVASSSVLPPTWKQVVLRGVGNSRRDYTVWNRILFPTGASNPTGADLSPWSVESIALR